MKYKAMDIERLHELLNYDPLTGILTWRTQRSNVAAGQRAGSQDKGGRIITCNAKNFREHRVAWAMHYGCWPLSDLDHIDGDDTNNRIANLRETTAALNQANSRLRPNKTGFKGVTKHRGAFYAHIKKDGKERFLGYFDTAEDAHQAYMTKAREFWGEFASDGKRASGDAEGRK